jgi:succinoglycan biosynthesis protein ExoA
MQAASATTNEGMGVHQVSVIMPVRNERDFIERSLGAVLGQDYPHEKLEVLVVDGMSTDGTTEYVRNHPDSRVRLVENPGKIVSKALNLGISNAQGDIIVRIDGHTMIAPDYVRCCVETLVRSGADNVGGRMNAIGSTQFGKAVAIATSSPFGVGNARFHYSQNEEYVDTVYMGTWWRSTFERNGFFDEELVRDQDDEFNYRLRGNGGKILLSPTILSEYFNRATVGSLFSQYFQYGCWKVRVLQKQPGQMRVRQFVPLVFVLAIGVGLSAIILVHDGWLLPIVGGMAYLASALYFGIRSSPRSSLSLLPRILLSFFILHVSYGAGFAAGLVRFRDGWGRR